MYHFQFTGGKWQQDSRELGNETPKSALLYIFIPKSFKVARGAVLTKKSRHVIRK